MKKWRKLFCLLALAAALALPPNGSPCGPFFPQAVFAFKTYPGRPLKAYAEGNLGVVQPSYYRSYLVVAYRYFSGHPLSRPERDDTLKYWGRDFGRGYDWSRGEDAVKEWLAARMQALGPQGKSTHIVPYLQEPDTYYNFYNCLDDAFHNATLTLKDRARRYGSDNAAVQEWIKGQDTVFADCDGSRDIPAAVAESSPAWLKADRQYQIAAAYFYSRYFDHAAEEFDRIARDAGSPWRRLAPYLAARVMIRQGMTPEPMQLDSLRDAESRLQRILADPTQSSMHEAARAMLGFTSLRLRFDQRSAELARRVAGPRPDPGFYQDLIDYTWTLDHLGGGALAGFPEWIEDRALFDRKVRDWRVQRFRDVAAPRAIAEMTDWILTFQQQVEPATRHAIDRWRVKRSVPWLVAALSKVDAGNPVAGELLQAAEQVPADSPAYPTVTYQRIRLMAQAGEHEKARTLLDAVLQSPPRNLSASALNLFLNLRMRLAGSYQDFQARAPRLVLDVDAGYSVSGEAPDCQSKDCREVLYGSPDKTKKQLRFDNQAAWILNLRLPLDLLAQSATGTDLPEPLRGELAVATWTRAVMLERHDIAAALVPEIGQAYPIMAERLQTYSAGAADDKKAAALFVLLHFPGMRPYVNAGLERPTRMDKIDNYRDNWWCGDVGAEIEQVNFEKDDDAPWRKGGKPGIPKQAPVAPPFLTVEQQKKGEAEWQQLAASGPASSYLARETLAWAKAKPNDPRLPEALHFAVRSTRYGCDGAGVSKLSHKAFALLHERYPNSKWAKATPYWY
jgi:hypothetical protein